MPTLPLPRRLVLFLVVSAALLVLFILTRPDVFRSDSSSSPSIPDGGSSASSPSRIEPAVIREEDAMEKALLAVPLNDLHLSVLDGQSPEDSRSLELTGMVGSGVTGIVVWSSCDDDSYRVKGFKTGNTSFTYKIGLELGNLCRFQNAYVVKALDHAGKNIQENTVNLESRIGIERQADLAVLRFMESHTLPAEQSIEGQALFPVRVFPSISFKDACKRRTPEAQPANTPITPALSVRLDLVSPPATASGAAANLQPLAQFSWMERSPAGEMPSTALPPLYLDKCYTMKPLGIVIPRRDRAFVQAAEPGMEREPMYFNGTEWMNPLDILLQAAPIERPSLDTLRLSIGTQSFSISDTVEHRFNDRYFPDRRPEYIFSLEDSSFRGVVWHRRR